jgi:hypothetical protein
MENFYLAYIVNGLIGLFVGYVWGVYDGFRVNGLIGLFVGYVWGVYDGFRTGLHKAQKAAQSDSKAKTDNHPQEP